MKLSAGEFLALTCLCALALPARAQQPFITPTYSTTTTYSTTYTAYDPDGPGGDGPVTYHIRITAPNIRGVFPIGILLGGTSNNDGSLHQSVLATRLAQRGVIAAEVAYNNSTARGCGCDGKGFPGQQGCGSPFITYYHKAQAIFDVGNRNSAIRRVVRAASTRKAQASLARGVVVIGHSQGTVVGRQANNWLASYVRGAYFTGSGNRPRGGPACGRQDWYCNESAYPGVIPGDSIRFMTGERDVFFSEAQDGASCGTLSAESTRTQQEKISGCLSTTDTCELSGGGGWRVIRNSLVEDGIADHSYFDNDSTWRELRSGLATMPWTLADNLDWLVSRLDIPERGFQRSTREDD